MGTIPTSPHIGCVLTKSDGRGIDGVVSYLRSKGVVEVSDADGDRVEQVFARVLGELKEREEIRNLEVYSVAPRVEIPPCFFLLKQKVYINLIHKPQRKQEKSLKETLKREPYIRNFPLKQEIEIWGRAYVWDCGSSRFHIVIKKVAGFTTFYFEQEGHRGPGQLLFADMQQLIVF